MAVVGVPADNTYQQILRLATHSTVVAGGDAGNGQNSWLPMQRCLSPIRLDHPDRPIRIVLQFRHFHIPQVRFARQLHVVIKEVPFFFGRCRCPRRQHVLADFEFGYSFHRRKEYLSGRLGFDEFEIAANRVRLAALKLLE